MKWFVIIALGLFLVFVCVVRLRHEERPPIPAPAVPVVRAPVKRQRMARPPVPKATPPAPVDISGPLKDRELIHWVLPDYPDWAQEQGIVGVTRLKINVTPAGDVLSLMEPLQLSGEPRLDEKAMESVRQWKFAEKPNSFGNQWGVVTVRFSLESKENTQPTAGLRGLPLGQAAVAGAWECVRKWVGEAQREFVYICSPRKPHSEEEAH